MPVVKKQIVFHQKKASDPLTLFLNKAIMHWQRRSKMPNAPSWITDRINSAKNNIYFIKKGKLTPKKWEYAHRLAELYRDKAIPRKAARIALIKIFSENPGSIAYCEMFLKNSRLFNQAELNEIKKKFGRTG